ncbi:thiol-specific monooxygenase [Arthroderma uncinatum]|uniref:thiol-specific monooxygenase n=1 Tax=Arthroderma uncinatum TaxID=74035 RepID=UPI00144A569B|nr:thiol-specific monooxygenase [Arthroderma uncinatum]KAF3479519.1 thiol-specific monooxygenase [Arthroderma uncinatum]
MTRTPPPVRRVAIIGAGACGLVAAKYLLAEECFDKIDLFEQRSCVGGVWNLNPAEDKDQATIPVPAEDPNVPLEEPFWHTGTSKSSGKEATFLSPLYEGLETNIPHGLMRFSDLPFPDRTQLFPKFKTVLEYLEKYSLDVKHLIQFQVQVLDITPADTNLGTWTVTRKDLVSGELQTDVYDAVVIANGHYNVPHVPSVPGMTAWKKAYPQGILHSKQYLNSAPYKNKKVVVVGNSASGLDIGSQISKVCQQPLISSIRSESYFLSSAPSDRKEYPPIAEFMSPETHNRAIRFSNGEIEEDVDVVLFCTGYLYSFPFLSGLDLPVITDGGRTLHVYQHLFYIEQPTLVFPGLHQKVIPFIQAENQCAAFARVWSGRLNLPSKKEMYEWENSNIEARGPGKAFHALAYPLDADYLNQMYDWVASAKPRPGLPNDGHGKWGPRWSEKERWIRSKFTLIKQAYAALGDKRGSCLTLEELGFDYEATKKEQEKN